MVAAVPARHPWETDPRALKFVPRCNQPREHSVLGCVFQKNLRLTGCDSEKDSGRAGRLLPALLPLLQGPLRDTEQTGESLLRQAGAGTRCGELPLLGGDAAVMLYSAIGANDAADETCYVEPRRTIMPERRAIIVGAGPAGLTAALELLERTDIKPIVLEAARDIGGISKTVNYRGNRIDIGGHRFFSKSARVMTWWNKILPVDPRAEQAKGRDRLWSTTYSSNPKTMLIRERVSRIYFLRKFFDYPVTLTVKTIRNLGFFRMVGIGLSYIWAMIFSIHPERSLEDFFVNRFGRQLYATFFRDYTEKVWGVPCSQIKPDWGAQRVKGLSITKALMHAVRQITPGRQGDRIARENTETTLIERFLYPKLGPGQLWEEVADRVRQKGGQILTGLKVVGMKTESQTVREVLAQTTEGKPQTFSGDLFFSTMPIKELIAGLDPAPPADVQNIARGLEYRDFITVGLLVKRLLIRNETKIQTEGGLVPDNWIYVQERDVKVGRLQIFNNWSPFMVAEKQRVWIGLEYFCNVGDSLWSMSDTALAQLAISELAKIAILDPADVLDSTVLRMEKTYPAYFGTYDEFDRVRDYCSGLENLFLIGRNGMHRYNNADHSILTAMTAVDNIVAGVLSKENIWAVNTEQEYHEEKDGHDESCR